MYRSSDRWSTRDGIGTIEKGLARSRDRVPNTPRGVLRGSVVRACAIPAKVRCRKHVKWTERRPLPSREQITCAVLTFATSTRSGTSSASTCTSAGARSDIGHRTDGVAARRGYDREGTRSERGLDDMTKNLAIRVPNTPRGVLRLSVRAARAWFTSVAYSLNQQRAPERVQRPTSERSTNTPRGVFKSCAAVPEGQRPFRAAAPAPPDPIPAPRHPAPRSRRHGFALPPPGSSPSARALPSSARASAAAA